MTGRLSNFHLPEEPGTQFVVETCSVGPRGREWLFFVSKRNGRLWAACSDMYEWPVEESQYRALLEWVQAKKKSGWLRSGNWRQNCGDCGIRLRISCIDKELPVCLSITVAKPTPESVLQVLHELLDRCGALVGQVPGFLSQEHLPTEFMSHEEWLAELESRARENS
ncbi:hypothetical protein [Roseimicrobium sp. ORNL1]|uniref:hypothetical protein n=1 Tax=Roseimicrobium sp. ORNL1 TaxID=2711231 RepID=UPI0013E15098|nr:hypothetical protein [Roseimicrobium sp. ORNL1]QIF05527.1 hypothetical protein G5S37_29855 [Roseimicrobium sp. ORNL1]